MRNQHRVQHIVAGLLGVVVIMGLGASNGNAESAKAMLHDTGVKIKDATHNIGHAFKHGAHKTRRQVKTGTVTKPVKHWGHKIKRNWHKAIGK